ncbi:MAG TPA: CAP domain-containing protein, partial [Candidatus Gracilibacteria bacterium]|nr:CAP domain-containing protein [Candidatus Gracilibacteria bacterium]
ENDFEFIRVIIFQADETKIFYFRQGIENFDADYPDFEEFGEGTVNMWVEGANLISEFPLNVKSEWSEPVKKTFTAATHQYTFHGDELSIPSLPETFLTPQTITIEGTTNTDIFVEGAVIRPDGFVDTVNLKTGGPTEDYYGAEIISAGNSFTYAYQPAKIGTYNVEINGTDGSAVLNSPVYISQGVPLIPDFFDLNRYARPEENFNLSDARTEMLKLINEERIKVGRAPIVMDDELNTLAQLHSKDMLTRNFFSHINPDGETPNDRRKELDIATSVSENLAISPTVLYTHKGLMQSAVHRRNIIDDAWSKVGIGIVTQTDGSLITTEEFSGDPLDESDFSAIRNEILSQMNEIRSAENISSLWVNTDLQAAANEWSDIMAAQEFFDFTAPNGETLSGIVQDYVPDKAVQALILESSGTDKLISEAAQSEDVTMSQWTKVGIGLAADAIGTIKATILFTTNGKSER